MQTIRPDPSTERCLLVALVQIVYTTYGNDSIHFGVGTAMAAPSAAGTAMTVAPVAAGAMAMATAPTAAAAAQRRQQGHQ